MTPPDDAPQTGQRVWRFYYDGWFYDAEQRVGCDDEPGVWHSLDPKALSATHAALDALVAPYTCSDSLTIQIMQALGLTPPEPKEGGR